MKKILFLIILSGYSLCYGQQNEINFLHQNINFSAAPRGSVSPMSLKMWDNYNNGGPSSFGTVFEFHGLGGHHAGQLYFGGWDNSKVRYRDAFYGEGTWSDWITLLDSKNNLESAGSLMINGAAPHFINGGNVGIGTSNPQSKLDVVGGNGIFVKAGDLGAGSGIAHFQRIDNSSALYVRGDGNVGIGTATPQEKLSVNGKVRAHEIKVQTSGWPDYVFAEEYKPKTLAEIAQFIKVNRHLPEVPSAKDVEKNGVELGEMNKILLKKIEEMTLLLIEQNKRLEKLEQVVKKD